MSENSIDENVRMIKEAVDKAIADIRRDTGWIVSGVTVKVSVIDTTPVGSLHAEYVPGETQVSVTLMGK